MSARVDPSRAFEVGETAAPFVRQWLKLLELGIADPTVRRYVLCWFAWKIQNPGLVPGTIVILIGHKGIGKNSVAEPIVRMFGAHGAVYDDPEQVAGRFTDHLMDKCFVVLDEALFSGDPRQADRIKARVTATTCTFEGKGLKPVQGFNRAAYVLLTNHKHAWQATWDERRAAVVNFSDALRTDRQFWDAYHASFTDEGTAQLLGFLQALDVADFNPRVIPQSQALREQQALTALRSPVAAWWWMALKDGAVRVNGRTVELATDEQTEIHRDELRDAFSQHCSRSGAKLDWAPAAREMRRFGLADPVRRGAARAPHYLLPPLAELRAKFSEATGANFDD